MRKEQKATELCRAMWDRVKALEDALKDSKVKMLQQHREYDTSGVTQFFEGNSPGAELLKAALVYPDMYS